MRIFFDTEFLEDGRTIDLLSIGMVREDGATYYAINADFNVARTTPWLRENVLPVINLSPRVVKVSRTIAQEVLEFVGDYPEFWAYYADYDWVCLCQLYGTMMHLPRTWPMYCMDLKQLAVMLGDPEMPPQVGREHNALDDAVTVMTRFDFLHQQWFSEFGTHILRRVPK